MLTLVLASFRQVVLYLNRNPSRRLLARLTFSFDLFFVYKGFRGGAGDLVLAEVELIGRGVRLLQFLRRLRGHWLSVFNPRSLEL